MNRVWIIILVLAALLFPLTAAAFWSGTVPSAADSITEQLDEQLMMRYAGKSDCLSSRDCEKLARANIMIMGTTAANINDLERTCALARQMTEEVSRGLMAEGYRYQELRKGRYIRFDKHSGELLLTRDVSKLASRSGTAQAVLAGTYVITPEQVRFSLSLIHVNSNEVLAKGTATVEITDDIRPLLDALPQGAGHLPTSYTRLQ